MARKGLSTLLGVFVALVVACGGGSARPAGTQPAAAAFPQTFQGSDGQAITLEAQPQRIVSLSSDATEIFCAVGAGAQLVAVDRYANCPLGSSAKPELDAYKPSLEAIAAYRPDLVFVSVNSSDVVQNLRRLNIPVLYVQVPPDLAGVLDRIRLLARASGHAAEGERLAQKLQSQMDQIKQKLAGVTTGPRVYHELDTTYFSAAPSSFVGDFYTFLKAQNIAEGASTPYPQLSAEVIVQRNPQVIVLADEAAGVTVQDVKARPGWSAIDAVKNGRICVVDPDIVSRPGPRIIDALDTLAKCLYPDKFQ
jgi:iron complex transport system substrate-binding protein